MGAKGLMGVETVTSSAIQASGCDLGVISGLEMNFGKLGHHGEFEVCRKENSAR